MSAAATYLVTIPSSHAALSQLRHDLRDWLDTHAGAGLPPVVDIDLVVTELAANAIDHADADTVDVAVAVDDERVRVEVANDTTGAPAALSSEWAEAGERGRGLRLVSALASGLWLESGEGRSVVVAELVADRQPVGEA